MVWVQHRMCQNISWRTKGYLGGAQADLSLVITVPRVGTEVNLEEGFSEMRSHHGVPVDDDKACEDLLDISDALHLHSGG